MSFSLTPLVASAIPRPDAPGYAALKAGLLDSANALLDSLPALSTLGDKRQTGPAWRKRSTQNKRTPSPTYCYDSTSLATEGFKFHTRISRHAGSSLLFDGFAHGLLKDHSINESRYIESCSEAKLIEIIEPGVLEIWQMSYKLPPPASNRDFLILILTIPTTADPAATTGRSFQVISIPCVHPDAPERKGYVRARYVSIEDIREVESEVVWRMSTASDAGGLVPKWVSEFAMPSKVAEDVPSFVNWMEAKKE